MTKYWLAFDIGCIECGEDSRPLGLFRTKDEARSASDLASALHREHWTGQHSFEVFEVEAPPSSMWDGARL